ncbi:MAG: NTP transferase domain-containing protein [Muribaculaceae bacterium]|nr:NTP transferase domain-containing protein [Muribaculaceae bacterium]MDE6803847.1 NTP transferase domain-containing protein [Muribaculaceae bacterium]MDE7189125.1 NTP transferase domain-containing protein [Muribaculaceae bacterium]
MHFGIIAAGEGSRLRQEGVELPKPLVRLDGTPMIERLTDIFVANGAESVSIIINEYMTQVADFLDDLRRRCPVPVEVVVKTTPSSMHSFFEMSNLMRGRGRFILTTVDTVFRPADFARYVEAFREAPDTVDAMMAVTSFVDDEKPLYVDTAPGTMRITAFSDTPCGRFISGGIYGLSQPAIGVLDDCMTRGVSRMRNYQRALLEAGLNVQAFDLGKIVDVDHAGDIATAETFLHS